MKIDILRRAAVLAGVPALILGATALPADAAAAGTVSAESYGTSGTASGNCTYAATLPSTRGFNYIGVAFTGTARATSYYVTAVPVSTSIQCYLRYDAWGSAGITMPGPLATTAGTGEVWRLALNPQICTVVSAAFSDGTVSPPTTNCHSL